MYQDHAGMDVASNASKPEIAALVDTSRVRTENVRPLATTTRHPEIRVQRLAIGRERAPLLVVDNPVGNPAELVELAATKMFAVAPYSYPGLRAKAPLSYQHFVLETLRPEIDAAFGLAGVTLRFTECNFSLVTTPAEKLTYLQRIPHTDSLVNEELAMVHYLFRANYGGTAFYRHRATGYEYVDEGRQPDYLRHVEREQAGPHSAPAAYINGDTPLYERIDSQDGAFNRLLMYRRTSLHSACIAPGFIPDTNPRTGRLSINGFIA
jgi:hypothetical protein